MRIRFVRRYYDIRGHEHRAGEIAELDEEAASYAIRDEMGVALGEPATEPVAAPDPAPVKKPARRKKDA